MTPTHPRCREQSPHATSSTTRRTAGPGAHFTTEESQLASGLRRKV